MAKTFMVQVDAGRYRFKRSEILALVLLTRADKDPERHAIYQKVPGNQPRRVQPDEIVDLSPGDLRFVTLPLEQTDGRASA